MTIPMEQHYKESQIGGVGLLELRGRESKLAAFDAITFDYWQTLVQDTPEGLRRGREIRTEGVRKVLDARGVHLSDGEIDRAYDESGQRIMRIWARDEDISPTEQVLIFLQCLDLNSSNLLGEEILEELELAYSTPLLQALPRLCLGAREILLRVQQSGCRIGLISNTGRTPGYILRQVLERFEILSFFNVLTFSDERRVRKPHPRIFLHHLEEQGVRPERALHVGDDLRCDVGGAKGVGMRAIHLDRDEEKRTDVQPDGIVEDLTQLHDIIQRLERHG